MNEREDTHTHTHTRFRSYAPMDLDTNNWRAKMGNQPVHQLSEFLMLKLEPCLKRTKAPE